MEYESNTFAGDGFTPGSVGDEPIKEPGSSVEEPDALLTNESDLWDCAPGCPEEWLKDWNGRQKTHDMFQRSYE
jgi:hypothetical protein